MSNKSRRGRPIQGQSREVLWNVHDFMTKEAQEAKKSVFTPERFADVIDRTARAAKVPKKTVIRILHEKKEQDSNHAGPNAEPQKNRKEDKRKTLERLYLNDYEYQNIRQIIYDLHLVDKQQVTMKTLLNKLKEIEFPGGRNHLRQIVKELGFKFKKINSNCKLLTEAYKVRLLRIKYLKQVKMYRKEGRDIVFGNEMCIYLSQNNEVIRSDKLNKDMRNQCSTKLTIVHAGSANGFVPNALLITASVIGDQCNAMNKENYEKWLKEQLVPNLQHNSIFVVDNATYSRTLEDRAPNSNATKETMQDWLTSKNIPFDPTLLKPELYDIIKKHKHQYVKYSLATIMESHGHKVLTLPPYFPNMNPMKRITFYIEKHLINEYQDDISISEVQHLITEKFSTFPEEEWFGCVNEAIMFEDEYLTIEDTADVLDQLTVNNNDGSLTSDSSQGDSTESSDTNSEAESEPVQPSTSK